jgi:hypothetical protein
MVALISQAKLEQLNIDSIERAIVLSALALRASIVGLNDEDEAYDKVEITTVNRGKNELHLNLDITLPLSVSSLANFGGSILSSIDELVSEVTSLESTLNLTITDSLSQSPMIPEYPSSINTFEQYFYYYVSVLYASLNETRNQIIRIVLVDNNDEGSEVNVKIILPLDANKFALGHNLVEAVDRVTSTYIDASNYFIPSNTLSTLSNSTFLNNSHTLIN